ncbi:MAG: ABC transporter permease subunit [Alphaproteobacteria bacterium]|nr:ABC transporter permease subunit [Alphaproteobacteria bacterium]
MRWIVLPLLAALDPPMRAIQRRIGIERLAYVFLLPTMVIFGIFSFLPTALNVWISFTGGSSTLVSTRPFVGLDNYAQLLACESIFVPKSCPVAGFGFWTGMWNTLAFALVQVPAMVVVALATAIVLNRKIRARGFWRALFFYPVMLSPVVIAVIWDWVLKRRGILNALLADATNAYNAVLAWLPFQAEPVAAFQPVNWLGDANSAWPFFWVVFVYSWSHLGFFMLILLAGLQAIPKDLYEAAEMDGTPPWRVFARITLPLLMPTLLVVLVLSLIRAFQVFDEVYVLTGGGPGTATRMVIQQIYETAFVSEPKLFGVAAASSVLLAGIILVLTLVQLALSRKQAGG